LDQRSQRPAPVPDLIAHILNAQRTGEDRTWRPITSFCKYFWIGCRLSRRTFLNLTGAAGLGAAVSLGMVEKAFAAGENQASNRTNLGSYDYIVIGAGASGAIVAGELSKTGAKVLVVESGGADTAPTISNPSIWFYNIGGALDWKLPIAPVAQLNNHKFNMALGHVLGGGSSINALVWSRGMARDYDGWERGGAKGWGFKDVLRTYKAQEDWEGGANEWRGAGGPVHIRKPGDPHPTAPAFIEAARQMGFAVHDDANGPMREGAGYINISPRTAPASARHAPSCGRTSTDRTSLFCWIATSRRSRWKATVRPGSKS
jgi:choline dehydrogenase